MPGGGQLILSAAAETVPADGASHSAGLNPGCYLRFSVADAGTGMNAATLARATEPFFTTKRTGAGTGLGLAMAKAFADQSGGALSIESTPGLGTTVTLWLPAADPAGCSGGAQQETATPAGVTRSARVLLVEDEDLVREVVAEALEDAGFRTVVAANGTEAISVLAAREAVDLLVTDFSMPYMNGVAVIRAARQLRPGLPALLLTGYALDGSDAVPAEDANGGFSMLRKPVTGSQLIDRLRTLLAESGAAG
jgi:CheY-like chemotaxis protein